MLQLLGIVVRGRRSDKDEQYWSFLVLVNGNWLALFLLYVATPIFAPILLTLHLILNPRFLISPFRLLSPTRTSKVSPPLSADYLLSLFLSRKNKAEIIGDLTEEFHEEIVPAFGLKAARFWYWKKALCAITERNPIARRLLVGGGLLKAGEMLWKSLSG